MHSRQDVHMKRVRSMANLPFLVVVISPISNRPLPLQAMTSPVATSACALATFQLSLHASVFLLFHEVHLPCRVSCA